MSVTSWFKLIQAKREASYNSPDLFNKFADPSEADPDPEDDVPPTIDGNSVGFATASGAKIAVDQKDNNSGNQENTATTNEKMAHMV